MQVTASNGGLSGLAATLDVTPETTGMDILHALFQVKEFGLDPTGRYVISIPKSGTNLPADGSLGTAQVQDHDQLIVSAHEQGF